MLLDGIILKCSSHVKGERTIAGIYHVLTGKKSIQTVQDIHIYKLENFYGIYKSLHKQDFDKRINELKSNHFLYSLTESAVILTNKGREHLKKNYQKFPHHYFKGLKYMETSGVFLERLLLLIQTLTNSKMKNMSFIPIIEKPSVTNWVKSVYKKMSQDKENALQFLYDELNTLLTNLSEMEAGLFVDRLTGYQHYGMSIYQLGSKYEIDVKDVHLLLVGLSHRILDEIYSNLSHYRIMSLIVKDLSGAVFITNSAKQTYKLMQKQIPIDKIAQLRRLKINTIYDHLAEIALYDTDFPLHYYVNEIDKQTIIEAIKQTNSYKLKDIKENVHKEITYFQIRLVLAVTKVYTEKGDSSDKEGLS